jgi:hypothetical protein
VYSIDTIDALLALRELLADESHWCQGVYARDAAGLAIQVNSAAARSYCLMGAILRGAGEEHKRVDVRDAIVEAIYVRTMYDSIDGFNDACGTQHEDVVWLIDQAIADVRENLQSLSRLNEIRKRR